MDTSLPSSSSTPSSSASIENAILTMPQVHNLLLHETDQEIKDALYYTMFCAYVPASTCPLAADIYAEWEENESRLKKCRLKAEILLSEYPVTTNKEEIIMLISAIESLKQMKLTYLKLMRRHIIGLCELMCQREEQQTKLNPSPSSSFVPPLTPPPIVGTTLQQNILSFAPFSMCCSTEEHNEQEDQLCACGNAGFKGAHFPPCPIQNPNRLFPHTF
jgi:hypothetical protein